MAVSADLDKLLDKQWEDKSLEEVLAAPVSALAGISEADGALLQQALSIKTVADLGRNRIFRAAQALWDLGQTAK